MLPPQRDLLALDPQERPIYGASRAGLHAAVACAANSAILLTLTRITHPSTPVDVAFVTLRIALPTLWLSLWLGGAALLELVACWRRWSAPTYWKLLLGSSLLGLLASYASHAHVFQLLHGQKPNTSVTMKDRIFLLALFALSTVGHAASMLRTPPDPHDLSHGENQRDLYRAPELHELEPWFSLGVTALVLMGIVDLIRNPSDVLGFLLALPFVAIACAFAVGLGISTRKAADSLLHKVQPVQPAPNTEPHP